MTGKWLLQTVLPMYRKFPKMWGILRNFNFILKLHVSPGCTLFLFIIIISTPKRIPKDQNALRHDVIH